MPDETRLNQNLPDDLLAIEASLRAVPIPASTIDHDSVLYQAGWAAAMAERSAAMADNTLPRSVKTKPRFWPAVAMTFAASTAACLAVMVWRPPTANETTTVATRQPVAVNTPDQESLVDQAHSPASASPSKPDLATGDKRIQFQSYQSNLAALLGLPQQPIARSRKAQLERLLDDVGQQAQFVTSSAPLENDIDAEADAPLTTGSPLPDVL